MPTTPNKSYSIPDKGAKNWHADLNGNFNAIDGDMDTLDTALAEFASNADLVANGHEADSDTEPATALAKVSNEMADARGALGTLDARLDVSLNEDGTLKTTTTSGDQWPTQAMTNPAYANAASFTVDGDATGILQPGTSLKVVFATSGTRHLHVKSASYDGGTGKTTVNVWDDETVPNETINSVAWGFVRPNTVGAAGTPGSAIRAHHDASAGVYRYNADSYDDPFNTTGGRVAKTNAGRIAYVAYASGLDVGCVYTAASGGGRLDSIIRRIITTPVETWTVTRDGTTGLITDFNRS